MKNRAVFWRAGLCRMALAALVALAWTAPAAFAQDGYQRPPKDILDVLHAPVTPAMSVSPTKDYVLLYEAVRYPPISELAQPMLRLAGLRINPATNGPHRATQFTKLILKRVSDGSERPITLPVSPYFGLPLWSPDGQRFAFARTGTNRTELWVGDVASAAVRRLPGVALNAAVTRGFDWMPDGRTLLCLTLPARRGMPPAEPTVPEGPNVQENYGRPGPAPTFQDLLQNAHDEDLFDYYAAAQLILVDVVSGRLTAVGKPAVFTRLDPAPDGQHILVVRTHRPYSYLLPLQRFPQEIEVWNRAGKVVHQLASLPLAENVPLGGVPTGPRNVQWLPTDSATLVWVEALDGGDPRKKVPYRDRILWLKPPFTGQPVELAKTEHRFAGLTWGERGDLAILREFDRDRNWTRAWFLNPQKLDEKPRLVWDMSTQERYRNPGAPMMRVLPNGSSAMVQYGNSIFLSGAGATPEGDRPFLDRFDTTTLKAERLFRCEEKIYEAVNTLLTPDGSRFLTRQETPSSPPNYFIRTAGSNTKQAFTSFPDPVPQLRGIKKELVRYKRADGVDLTFTLYLPPDYKPGERRPAVVWAYPVEFTDPALAGQVAGSPYRFTTIGGASQLFFLLAGYVVLDDASMPVVGDPQTVNNTYVEQIVSSAKAAMDKANELGVIDSDRVGVGGHSYGAFMTANLLAHSDLFRAGIARSGAYNRTLTPFGFQNERRTLWEAVELYVKVSPFVHANRINEPILLIHGEADNNTGTFPIQSERMYHALKGNGGSVRYVTLPHEAHGYAARESIEHTIWEMLTWFDKHVKNAPPRDKVQRAAAEPDK